MKSIYIKTIHTNNLHMQILKYSDRTTCSIKSTYELTRKYTALINIHSITATVTNLMWGGHILLYFQILD